VWDHEEFTKGAAQDFVLLSLDFTSRGQPAEGVANPARHTELKDKYEIRGFPTVLLMTPDGEVFAQTGYKPLSPEEYLADVRSLRTKGKKAIEDAKSLTAEYEKAKDAKAKVAVIRRAIAALESAGAGVPAGKVLAETVRQGIALDPENKEGLKLECVKVLVLQGHAAPGEMALALEFDPKNEMGLMEAVVSQESESIDGEEARDRFIAHALALFEAGKVHKTEKVAMCFAYAAYFINQDLGNPEKAKPLAKKALELGGMPEQVVTIMKEIVGEQ